MSETPADRSKAVDLALDDARGHLVAGLAAIEAAKVMLQPPAPPAPPEPDIPDEGDEEDPLPPVEPLPPVDPEPIPPTPPQPPAPPKMTGAFTTASPANLKPLSGRLPAQLSELEAHRVRASRWPNPEAALTAVAEGEMKARGDKLPAINIKSMRQMQSYLHELMLETAVTQNQRLPYKLADLVLTMRTHLVDRSVPNPLTGKYATQLTKGVARAKALLKKTNPNVTDAEAHAWADQPGLLRMYYYFYGDGSDAAMGYSDFTDIERSLSLGTLAEMAVYFKQNERLGQGRNSAALEFLLELLVEHMEPRNVRMAQLFYGANAKPWYAIKSLRHAALSHLSYYDCMYQLTGEGYWSTCADEIWDAYQKDFFRFELPDGRDGLAFPHYTNGITKLRGQKGGSMWHNTVYTAETAPRALITALLGHGRFNIKDTEALANTFYHTLFKWGWDGKAAGWKVAGDMGGGGSKLPLAERKIILTDKGVRIPAPYNIGGAKDGVEDSDSFIGVQRGMTLIGAAYTDIPDYEARLEHLKKTSDPSRRGTYMPLMLFESRRLGLLPGVR